jgi:hypothetical protein
MKINELVKDFPIYMNGLNIEVDGCWTNNFWIQFWEKKHKDKESA